MSLAAAQTRRRLLVRHLISVPELEYLCADAAHNWLVGAANIRRYTGDRRSPKPFGRITQDTRVILARFSIRYAEMITRVSVVRRVRVSSVNPALVTYGDYIGLIASQDSTDSAQSDYVILPDCKIVLTGI
jgi:hypothetical protein